MEIELFNNKLKVFECGKVLVYKNRKVNPEYYEKKCGIIKGYKRINLYHERKTKNYQIHRIIAFAFLGLDIQNPKSQIDHIDMNPLNNQVSNLRIVSNQENQFNKISKGYTKYGNKYIAQIQINRKVIYLGRFDTKEEARNAYLQAKLIHHIIK
tara:strand:+ start:195 stop:656 length:462 start_codon:yes stop_codon:yes gene_type:complete